MRALWYNKALDYDTRRGKSVFPPAVTITAVENLQVNGIVLFRSVLLYLEDLLLLSGRPNTALQCSKGIFRAFSFHEGE